MMTTTHVLLEDTWIGKNFINFSDVHARVKCHVVTGVSLSGLMMLHMWSILFPPIFSKFSLEVKSGSFGFPLSERKPKGFKDQLVFENKTEDGYNGHTMLQVDDVARLVVITIILVPLMIFGYKKFTTNYRLGIRIHQSIFLLYFIDLVRRHTHPHCWVFNVPVFFLWVLDKICGHCYQHETVKVSYFKISEDYSLVYFKLAHADKNVANLAQVYFSRLKGFKINMERKHPFTCFKNRNGGLGKAIHKIDQGKFDTWFKVDGENMCLEKSVGRKSVKTEDPVISKKLSYDWKVVKSSLTSYGHTVFQSPQNPLPETDPDTKKSLFRDPSGIQNIVKAKNEQKYDWSTAYILKIFYEDWSHTKHFVDYSKEIFSNRVDIWPSGSYHQIKHDVLERKPMVLVAGGAGANYVLDVISFIKVNKELIKTKSGEKQILLGIVFTCNDLELFKWVYSILVELKEPEFWSARIALTTSGNKHPVKSFRENLDFCEETEWLKIQVGRMNFSNLFAEDFKTHRYERVHVYCQGGAALQQVVETSCGDKFNNIHYNPAQHDV